MRICPARGFVWLQGPLVHEQFEAVAAARPAAVAVVDDATGEALTYGQASEAVDALACSLARLGITPGMGEET